MLLDRLDQRLPLLVASARDLPDRQRTIEATIEWSVGLLDVEPCELLVRLGVFAGDFSLEAAEAVGADAGWEADTLSLLTELIDNSLVRSQDVGTLALFGMLATVREFALARLESSAARPGRCAGSTRLLHAARSRDGAAAAGPDAAGGARTARGGARESARRGAPLLETGKVETLSRVVWDLFLYWWIRGLMPEARRWMDAILATGIEVSDRTRAIALGFSSWVSLWQERGGVDPDTFEESVRLFRAVGDPGSEALALCSLALAYLGADPPRPRRCGGVGARRARDRRGAGADGRVHGQGHDRPGACWSRGDLETAVATLRRCARAGGCRG